MKENRGLRAVSLAVCALLAAGFSGAAQAQSASPAQALLDAKFVANLGAFIIGTDVKAGLNGENSNNPEIDFDKTFGKADEETRFRGDALWRVTPNHHLRFLYFNNTVKRSKTLDQDVAWGDTVFHAGSEVRDKGGFKIAELAYEYAFVRQPMFELNGSIGVHYMKLHDKLSGDATVTDSDGNMTDVSGASKKSSLSAPLPVVGVRAGWAVAPQVYLEAQGQYFKAKINNYDGHLYDLRAGATWMFTPNWGLGAGYNYFKAKLNVDKSSFDGRFNLNYSGVQVYLTGAF